MKTRVISWMCSQQVIGGQTCKSSIALINKSNHHVDYIKAPSYFTSNKYNSPYNSGIVERHNHKNHYRVRDVVARNFEEINQILNENNLIMETNSSSEIHHKALDYKKVRKEIQEAFTKSGFEHSPYGGEFLYVTSVDFKSIYIAKISA